MKFEAKIVLEKDDRHILRHLEYAGNLAGVAEFDTKEMRNTREADIHTLPPEQQAVFLDLKALRRIKSDQFTMQDVHRAEALVRRLAAEKTARAYTGGVFTDTALQQQFSEGVRASAEQAVHELELFLDALQEMMRTPA